MTSSQDNFEFWEHMHICILTSVISKLSTSLCTPHNFLVAHCILQYQSSTCSFRPIFQCIQDILWYTIVHLLFTFCSVNNSKTLPPIFMKLWYIFSFCWCEFLLYFFLTNFRFFVFELQMYVIFSFKDGLIFCFGTIIQKHFPQLLLR